MVVKMFFLVLVHVHQLVVHLTVNYCQPLNDRWIIGDSNYSVGIGITNPSVAKVGPEDTQTFAAGIVTAYQISAAFFSAWLQQWIRWKYCNR